MAVKIYSYSFCAKLISVLIFNCFAAINIVKYLRHKVLIIVNSAKQGRRDPIKQKRTPVNRHPFSKIKSMLTY